MSVDFQIGETEAAEQRAFIRKALDTEDPEARRRILIDATLRFGYRLGASLRRLVDHTTGETRERLVLLSSEARLVCGQWFSGTQFSDSVDENERRARSLLDALDLGDDLSRLAAQVVGSLPENHPLRDDIRLVAAMERRLAEVDATGDLDEWVAVATELLSTRSLSPERGQLLVARALEVGRNVEFGNDVRRRATRAAMLWHFERLVRLEEGRDDGVPRDEVEHTRYRTLALELTSELRQLDPTPQDELAIGAGLYQAGEFEDAADTLAKAVDARSEVWRTAAWLEAAARSQLGHDARMIEVLASIVPLEMEEYVQALEPAEVAERGQRFTKDAVALALAYARQGSWADALAEIERTKSPRLRHLAKLRASDAGRELLVLEAQVASVRRGVPGTHVSAAEREVDPLGRDLTAEIRALEQYRAQRPDLALASIAPPTIAEASAKLAEGEGIVSLGISGYGLMMIGIVRGDTGSPRWTALLPELNYPAVLRLFGDGGEILSGWLLELASRAPVRPRRSLERLLRNVDAALGASLARFAAAHGLRRLTVVPHVALHSIPWWALASIAHLDVQVAPSLAHWMSWRSRVPRLVKSAVVVGNPTLDLEFALVEAASVATTLSALGYTVHPFVESAATEEAVRGAAKTSGILHFAGHGFSRPSEPLLCSLLMHPSPQWQTPGQGDPLRPLAEAAERWSPMSDFVRHADTATGRVVERYDEHPPHELVERQIDYSTHGTLWGEYYRGRLLRLAELWTTSDVLIDDTLETCALAFLCACESGRGGISIDIDEAVGIPSSLEVGGVDTVICTLWPVADVAALVFARLFYSELGASRETFDARAAVRTCRDRLAAMHGDAVVDLLRVMQSEASQDVVKALLQVAVREVRSMPELPFADPFHWAAFTCYGVERLELASE